MSQDTPSPTAPKLILASASPRRQQILREATFSFAVHPANIDEEKYPAGLLPADITLHLAREKARAVSQLFPDNVVLAADTLVALGDIPLGKPADAADARRMLQLLSGTTQIVITGVAVVRRSIELEIVRRVMSAVRMRNLTPREIDAYIATGQWQGKAGAYGIQDDDPFVSRMSGSLTNIVGLPIEETTKMLAQAGIIGDRL